MKAELLKSSLIGAAFFGAVLIPPLHAQETTTGTGTGTGTTNTETVRTDDNDTDFGWIGLIGLAGLAGLMGRSRDRPTVSRTDTTSTTRR